MALFHTRDNGITHVAIHTHVTLMPHTQRHHWSRVTAHALVKCHATRFTTHTHRSHSMGYTRHTTHTMVSCVSTLASHQHVRVTHLDTLDRHRAKAATLGIFRATHIYSCIDRTWLHNELGTWGHGKGWTRVTTEMCVEAGDSIGSASSQ